MARSRESRFVAISELLPRGAFALFFLGDGLEKLVHAGRSVEILSGMGLAFPGALNGLAVSIEVAGALCLASGIRVRTASLVLASYVLASSFLQHVPLAREHPSNWILVLRDLALAGGLVLLAGRQRRILLEPPARETDLEGGER